MCLSGVGFDVDAEGKMRRDRRSRNQTNDPIYFSAVKSRPSGIVVALQRREEFC